MKRTPIGFDAAAAISDVLGVPEGSSWQFAATRADATDAAPAFTTVSAVESGIDLHAAGIDLRLNVPASDILFAAATPTSSTDADIVSIWASPPSQPAETQIVGFGVIVAASQAQEEDADQIDTLGSQHGSAGLQPTSFAPVAFVPAVSANLAPALSASHTVDSFDFGLGADVGAVPQHMELPEVSAHTLTSAASPAVTALPADFAMLANPSSALDKPVTNSQVGSGGATAAQVQQALDESGLGVNGSGIKVGVLSDSFNDLGGAAADEANGALPPASDIQVLKDLSSGGSDEGRAMMQIIHDIAPGADLAFYTAFDSEQDFANGILALAAGGCKVIVDDVSYFDEPFFQNGIVAQAIQTVEAEGVTYVTAAGNEASNAYQAAWTPIAHTSYDGYSLSNIESFGGSPVQTVTVGGNVPLILEWNQPYGSATSNLEILAFQNGNLVGVSESEMGSNNPWAGIELSVGTYQIAIEDLSGPNPGLIKEIALGDGIPVTISGANVGTVYGHAMTPGAITAGAVSAADTPTFGDNSPTGESFSSSGAGTELLFANNGTALSSPDVLSPVALSGIDDIKTTVPGGLSDFYGTSAASASLAGVAALMLSANPNLTPAQVEQIMEETALPMSISAVSGAGLVQVDAAIAAAMPVPDVTVANVTLTQTSVAASSLFTVSDSAGYAITEYGFEDTGSGHFVLNGVVQADNQEIDVAAAQLSQLTYQSVPGATDTIEVRAADQAGWSNWASFVVTAPLVIQTDTGAYGSTSLAEFANNYFLYAAGTTNGPELHYDGAALTAGEFSAWTPIGAVQTATGYDVAWKDASAGLYTVWSTDNNGNYTANIIGAVSGNNYALELLETTFNQDLNGDGTIGVPTTVIQVDGTTSLTAIGPYYFLYDNGSDPELKYGGIAVAAGEFDGWTPIGAVQTTSGYDIAWKDASAGLYTVWSTDGDGNYTANIIGAVSGNSYALESLETTFHQDLNGDGVTGLNPTVIQTDTTSSSVSTSLAELGNNYFLYAAGTTNGPELQHNGAAVTAGEFDGWTPIGAVQTASGYDIAWKDASAGLYTVWSTDGDGNYTANIIGAVSGNSYALESLETTFHQDLNGDGVTGLNPTVIQSDTNNSSVSTSLAELGNNYFLYAAGTTNGPELQHNGAATAGEFDGWTPIGAVQTASGYDIAWKDASAGLYTVWSTDGDGNYTANIIGAVSGNSYALESLETTFHQDLNGDGVTGLNPTVIQSDTNNSSVSTSLAELGNNYFLYAAGTTNGPELQHNGAAVTAGEFDGWTPIGAVQTASGYDIAWKDASAGLYTVWSTDGDGNYTANIIGAVSGNSYALESLETTFHQDLNGDGVTGLNPTVIQSDTNNSSVSTSLAELGNNYFLYAAGTTNGPELQHNGAAVTAGEFDGWTPIGAVQTASGYDIAWKDASAGLYTVWSTDGDGNYTANIIGAVSGNSYALESLETTFHQDLNGDGVTGLNPTVIQSDTNNSSVSTSLAELGNNYFLYAAGTTNGPELQHNGAAVTAGEFDGWTPIGAVQTASGYDIAWKDASAGLYTVWSTDGDGNYTANIIGAVSGNSYALESLETTFDQDLNGDGAVGLYAAPGTTLQISQGPVTIGVGATAEVAGANSNSATFAATTGMLKIDQPSTFTGEIFGFTGNGTLAGSDQIDLKGINYNTVQDSYASGVLTVVDGTNTVRLSFSGSYSLGNFEFASDGDGGTLVYDPPVSNNSAPIRNTVTTDHSTDVFLFGPQLEQTVGTDHRYESEAVHFDHAQVACGLVAPVHHAPETMIIADAAHDVITFRDALAQSHQAHFLI